MPSQSRGSERAVCGAQGSLGPSLDGECLSGGHVCGNEGAWNTSHLF